LFSGPLDGEFSSLNRHDVEAHAGALIPENWKPCNLVDLSETWTILRTLFEFIGARKHPNPFNEKFEILVEVARAAEKYKVFSAMNICAERMRYGDNHTFSANVTYTHFRSYSDRHP
jgi:hypothetical protein